MTSAATSFRFNIPSTSSTPPFTRRKLTRDKNLPAAFVSGQDRSREPLNRSVEQVGEQKRASNAVSGTSREHEPVSAFANAKEKVRGRRQSWIDLGDAFTSSKSTCTSNKPPRLLRRPQSLNLQQEKDSPGQERPAKLTKLTHANFEVIPLKRGNDSNVTIDSEPSEQENNPPTSIAHNHPTTPAKNNCSNHSQYPPRENRPARLTNASTPPSAQPPRNPPTFVTPAPARSAWHVPLRPDTLPLMKNTTNRPGTPRRPLSSHETESRPQFTPKPNFQARTSLPSHRSTIPTTSSHSRLSPSHDTSLVRPSQSSRPRFSLPPSFSETRHELTAIVLNMGTLSEVFSPHKRKVQRFVNGGWAEEMRERVFAVGQESARDALEDVRKLLRGLT
ncbi:MAG: hypothetical protein Q9159_002717 [Coniocarpon cinnabarinum]